MAPAVGSSRPATMRSTVDFPQPDGPSRTMNSPSDTSRLTVSTATVPSPNTLVTSLSATVANAQPPGWPSSVCLVHSDGRLTVTVASGAGHRVNDGCLPCEPLVADLITSGPIGAVRDHPTGSFGG